MMTLEKTLGKGLSRRFSGFSMAVITMVSFSNFIENSFAAGTMGTSTYPTSTGAFQGVAGGGITANVGSCFTSAGLGSAGAGGGATNPISLAVNGGKKGGAKGAGAGGDCGADTVPDSSGLTCDSPLLQTNGTFDPKKLETQIESLSFLDGQPPKATASAGGASANNPSLSCELNEFNTIKSEMACVQQQGQLLTQQIGSLAQVYQQNITKFQKDQQAFSQREGDRQTQLDTITKLLGGNKDSGTKGLLQEQSDLQTLVNTTMPQDIAAAQAQAKTVANQRAIITTNIQKHTMSLTGDCFKSQVKAGYQCTPGGPDLSPENYITCMYGKYQQVQNGVFVQGATAASNAQAAQNTLQGILDQMYNQTSLSWTAPTDTASAQTEGSRPDYGLTIQDLINNYVGQTSGMTVNGISVSTVITNELESCYAAAQAEVQTEQSDPSSTIGQAEFQQTQSENALKAAFDQKLETYSEKWTEAMGVLTSQNLPLNLSNCKSQDITYEGNCLEDVQTQVTTLLKGGTPQTAFIMQVPAQFPDTTIPVTALQCQGINGCVTQLQAVDQQVTTAKAALVTARQSYETQARQSTDQFTSQMAQLLSAQSSQLRNQLSSINTTLQGLGVGTSISFPNVPAEAPAYDGSGENGGQGLPKMPTSVLDLIGGKMSPPMMDLTDNSNNDASAMAEGVNKVKDKMAKVAKVRAEWQADFSQCGVDAVNSQFEANITNCSDECSAFSKYLRPEVGSNPYQQKTYNGPNGSPTPLQTYDVVPGGASAVANALYGAALSSLSAASDLESNSNPDSDSDAGPDTPDGANGGNYSIHPSSRARSDEINKELSAINGLLSGCATQFSDSPPVVQTTGSNATCQALSNITPHSHKGDPNQPGGGDAGGNQTSGNATQPNQ